MGLFDYVRCNYPLPDAGANDAIYQTKDTEQQYLRVYTITEDGRLLGPDGVDTEFHGDLNFYASNWSGSTPTLGGIAMTTEDDKPWAAWDYVAHFTDGRITKLTGGPEPPWCRIVTHAEFDRLYGEWRFAVERGGECAPPKAET